MRINSGITPRWIYCFISEMSDGGERNETSSEVRENGTDSSSASVASTWRHIIVIIIIIIIITSPKGVDDADDIYLLCIRTQSTIMTVSTHKKLFNEQKVKEKYFSFLFVK